MRRPRRYHSTKSEAELDRELAALIAGDADLERRAGKDVDKIKKRAGSTPATKLMGYTQRGMPVYWPKGKGAPNTNDIVTFHKTKAKFAAWTKADFMDAAKLYDEARFAMSMEPKNYAARRQLERWSSVFWDIGGGWTAQEFEARHGSR